MEEILDQSSQFNEENGVKLQTVEERMNNLPAFDFSKYFNDAGAIYGKILGVSIGFLIVFMLIYIASAFIPFLNIFAFILVVPACFVGYYRLIGRAHTGLPFEFGDAFSGFKQFGGVTVVTLLRIVIFAVLIGLQFLAFSSVFMDMMTINRYDPTSSYESMLALYSNPLYYVFFLLGILVGVTIVFQYYFVMLRGVSGGAAVKYSFQLGWKKFFPLLGLFIVLYIINLVGALFIGIGLLFTIPLSEAILVAAFDHLIGIDESIL